MRNRRLDRRTVLRGLGVALTLPWLESLAPRAAFADERRTGPPRRLAFLFVPNGKHMQDWTPREEGRAFELPWILEPLAPHRGQVLVLSGLTQDQARAHGDGPGDHARSAAVYLTGAHPVKTAGKNIRVGVSVDQVAARAVGRRTRFPSLELGCDGSATAGNCDSGYSCAYSSNVSWRTPATPNTKEVDPRLLFERLFGSGPAGETAEQRMRRLRYRKSVLDYVRGDAQRLHGRLGTTDRAKLDEYLTGVRELEQRIELTEQKRAQAAAGGVGMDLPAGIPNSYRDHIRLLGDLMVLAFQLDETRIATFMLANAGSNRNYPEIGVPHAHHGISHHGNDAKKTRMIRKINRWHVEQLAYVLERMKSVKEGDGTLLDHTMLLYGSGIGDGNRHNHDDLPILLAGGGGGTIDSGRHVRYPRNTPLNNLFLAMLERAGVDVPAFGDSTGTLPRLS